MEKVSLQERLSVDERPVQMWENDWQLGKFIKEMVNY
jgi:hypothetical protein